MEALVTLGDNGGTIWELSKMLNDQNHSSVRAKLRGLVDAGLAKNIGVTTDPERMSKKTESVDVYIALQPKGEGV